MKKKMIKIMSRARSQLKYAEISYLIYNNEQFVSGAPLKPMHLKC